MVNRDSSLREVADRLSHLASYLIIRRHILKLEEEGKIKSNGQGRWIRFTWVG
jgi:DNA-binding transcriptional ArsR family regulator